VWPSATDAVSSLGVPFEANVVISFRHGERAGNNPWDAWTLEWATAPPPQILAEIRW
jgi:heme/copper-type cytochrome/quinol oxidase subunit 1